MWNCLVSRFQIRDIKNGIAIGEFMDWDDAAEWVFDLAHDKLNERLNEEPEPEWTDNE
jgi:hypothetical protein